MISNANNNPNKIKDDYFEPFHQIVHGCSVYSHILNSLNIQFRSYTPIENNKIIPYSIGIRVFGRRFKQFIQKGMSLPFSTSSIHCVNSQTVSKANFSIFKGEKEYTNEEGMVLIGNLLVNSPDSVDGNDMLNQQEKTKLEIHFSIDENLNMSMNVFRMKDNLFLGEIDVDLKDFNEKENEKLIKDYQNHLIEMCENFVLDF